MTDYDGQTICALTVDDLNSQQYRWPMLDVTWTIIADLRTLSREGFKSAATQACQMWMDVCGIRLHYVDNPRAANITMGIQSQGPGGVLADSEIPGPGTTSQTQLKQRYDTMDEYVVAENPPPNKIDLVRVIAHEVGHILGEGHLSSGNLLAPTYSTRIRGPQTGDIASMVARYGRRTTELPPPSPPPGEYREILAVLEKGGAVFVRKNGVISPL
jgi:hypothetical protein